MIWHSMSPLNRKHSELPGISTVIIYIHTNAFPGIQTTTSKNHRKQLKLVRKELIGVGGIAQRNLSMIGLLITNLKLLEIAKILKKENIVNLNNENERGHEKTPIDIGHLFDQKSARLNNSAITHSFNSHIPTRNKTKLLQIRACYFFHWCSGTEGT